MRLLAVIGALAIVVAIAAAVYFFGGFYSVAATEEIRPVAWVLAQVRQASVDRHATDGPPMPLDDAAVERTGAHAFATLGCINCHGAPGVNWAKFSEGMQPSPPDLKEIVNDREPRQLFWVIKNGIKMTAMPSFGAIGVPDQEIWSIVAFLKKLPTVSEEDFKTWSASAGG
jgi:mono/diheme cytochrome c family protein